MCTQKKPLNSDVIVTIWHFLQCETLLSEIKKETQPSSRRGGAGGFGIISLLIILL